MTHHDELQTIIDEDKKTHPKCNYSTSLMSSVKILNNEKQKEIVKKIIRHCPKEQPEEIKVIKESYKGDKANDDADDNLMNIRDPFRDFGQEFNRRGFFPFSHSFHDVKRNEEEKDNNPTSKENKDTTNNDFPSVPQPHKWRFSFSFDDDEDDDLSNFLKPGSKKI